MGRKYRQIENESYAPHGTLVSLIDDFLDKKREYEEELNKRKHSEPTEKEMKELDKKLRGLKRRKYDVLNVHIFRAMANLTYLLEKMQEDPLIRKIFEDDIKALFLTKSREAPTEDQRKEYMFSRFIGAACTPRLPKENEPAPQLPDFRALLWNICSYHVTVLMEKVAPIIFHQKFNYMRFPRSTIKPQLDSAHSWSELFAAEAYREHMPLDKETRPAQF